MSIFASFTRDELEIALENIMNSSEFAYICDWLCICDNCKKSCYIYKESKDKRCLSCMCYNYIGICEECQLTSAYYKDDVIFECSIC